jgi:hypothetical protein
MGMSRIEMSTPDSLVSFLHHEMISARGVYLDDRQKNRRRGGV